VRLLLIIFNRKYMKIFKHPSGVEVFHWLLKKLTIMKLIIALILIFNLNSFGKSYSQTRITLNVRGTELKKVLGLIEKQSDYHFLFSDRTIACRQESRSQRQKRRGADRAEPSAVRRGVHLLRTEQQVDCHHTGRQRKADKIQVTGKVMSDKGGPWPAPPFASKGLPSALRRIPPAHLRSTSKATPRCKSPSWVTRRQKYPLAAGLR
jgi:hypothetical protein